MEQTTDGITDDANEIIAPWFGRIPIEQQRLGMVMDFKQKLASLDKTIIDDSSNLFMDSFIDMFHGNVTDGYRNKNKFTFGYGHNIYNILGTQHNANILGTQHNANNSDLDLKLGFIGGEYPTTYIVSCDNACTINDNFKNICHIVEQIVKKSTIKPFLAPPRNKQSKKNNNIDHDKQKLTTHKGVWKYLTIRHSVTENKYMVILINFIRHIDQDIKPRYLTTIDEIKKALFDLEYVKSFNLHEYQYSLEPQADDTIVKLFEKDTDLSIIKLESDQITNKHSVLYEQILGYVLSISPNSFFQTNTEATIILYTKIREMFKYMIDLNTTFNKLEINKKRVLIDLYCGTGTIGICVSDLFDHIIGVDEVGSAIENANLNVELNYHKNKSNESKKFSFITGRCENSLEEIEKLYKNDDQTPDIYLVVDPTRIGLHKKVKKFIKDLNCSGFVYCSCNVQTWMSDVKDFMSNTSNTYTALQTLIIDVFPYTQHYEVLSCFKKH